MKIDTSLVGAIRRRSPGIGQIIRNWIADFTKRRRLRREMAELSHLPRHRLRDMGLEEYAQPRKPEYRSRWY